MYEITVRIEENALMTLLKFLETLQSSQVEKVVKRKLPKPIQSQKEVLLANLPLDAPLRQVLKPIRKGVTLQQILNEQNYKGTNWNRLDDIAKEMSIEEPLEVLLEQLKS